MQWVQGVYTPLGRHPMGKHPRADTPLGRHPPVPKMANEAGGLLNGKYIANVRTTAVTEIHINF